MKKILFAILIAFSILLTGQVQAQETSGLGGVNHERCGLGADGLVDPMDLSICRDDIAFQILFDNFRYIYEDYLFEIFDFKYIGDIDESAEHLSSALRISNLMSEIFKTLVDVSLIFITWVISYNVFIGIFKSLSEGEFLGRGDKKKQLVYYLLGIFLIIPVGDIFVVHLVIFSIITLALIPANFIYSYFIYSLMLVNAPSPSVSVNIDLDEYNHNYFYAAKQADFMTNMHICRKNTLNFMITDFRDVYSDDVREEFNQCNNPTNESYYNNVYDAPDKNAFVRHFSPPRIKRGFDDKYALYNTLNFGKYYHNASCQNNPYGKTQTSFDCGSINVSSINFNEIDSLKYGEDIVYQAIVDGVSSMNNNNYTEETIFNISQRMLSEYDARMKEVNQNSDSYEYSYGYGYKLKKFAENYAINSDLIRLDLTYQYHQALLNHLIVGTVIYKPKVDLVEYASSGTTRGEDRGNEIKYENLGFLNYVLTSVNDFADEIMSISCISDYQNIANTFDMIEGNSNNSKNSICLNIDNGDVYGSDMGYSGKVDESNISKVETAIKNAVDVKSDNLYSSYNSLINKIKKNRDIVEKSLVKSIAGLNLKEVDNVKSKLISARQQGFMSFPTVLMMIDDNYSLNEKARVNLAFSMETIRKYREKNKLSGGVTQDLDDGNEVNAKKDFLSNNVFDGLFTKEYRKKYYDMKYVDYRDDRSLPDMANDWSFMDVITKSLASVNPVHTLADALNVKTDGLTFDTEIDYNQACSNPELFKYCPLPKTNPLVAFHNVGASFFGQGVFYTMMGFVPAATSYIASIGSDKFDRKSPSDDNKANNRSKASESLRNFSKMANMLTGLLLKLGLGLIFFGLILMFMIPLVPFVYLLINFIQWIILCFSLMVNAPLFISFLFNIERSGKELNDFIRNTVLSLVLRPALIIMSMIFLWSFYYVVVFFMNLTVFDLMSETYITDNLWVKISAPFMFVALFIIILFTVTRFVFQTVTDIHEKVFQMLNVSDPIRDDNSMMDNLLVYMAGRDLYKSANQSAKDFVNDGEIFGKKVGFNHTQEKMNKRDFHQKVFDSLQNGDSKFEHNGREIDLNDFKDLDGRNLSIDLENKTVKIINKDKHGNITSTIEKEFRDNVDLINYIQGKDIVDVKEAKMINRRFEIYESFYRGGYDENLGVNWDEHDFKTPDQAINEILHLRTLDGENVLSGDGAKKSFSDMIKADKKRMEDSDYSEIKKKYQNIVDLYSLRKRFKKEGSIVEFANNMMDRNVLDEIKSKHNILTDEGAMLKYFKENKKTLEDQFASYGAIENVTIVDFINRLKDMDADYLNELNLGSVSLFKNNNRKTLFNLSDVFAKEKYIMELEKLNSDGVFGDLDFNKLTYKGVKYSSTEELVATANSENPSLYGRIELTSDHKIDYEKMLNNIKNRAV